MGCGEKKATHLITQVQLRLRNGQAVFPQPLKAVNLVRTVCGSGRFRFVNWQIEMSQLNRPLPQTVSDFAPYEDSSNWRCRR